MYHQTKKKRNTRRVLEDSDILQVNGEDNMDVDIKPVVPRPRDLDMNFVDDDDLQAALARQRRAKTQKVKKVTTEEIARKGPYASLFMKLHSHSLGLPPVVQERLNEQDADGDGIINVVEDDDDASGLTFDDTSEFVRAISYNPVVAKSHVQEVKQEHMDVVAKDESPEPLQDYTMNGEDATIEELEAGELLMKEEEDEEAMLHALEGAIRTAEADAARIKQEENNGVDVGTSSEQTFGSGMAATLNILRQQGVLATPSADEKERERVQRHRDLWLAEYRTRVAHRELERMKARGEKRDQAQREYENRLREQQEARESLDVFKDYKPDVNIVYHDEFGRELTPKEAWKALSHRFHGKSSGKAKTEKRLKKIAEERKKEAMASGDTPLSMNKAFQMRQEKTGQAHFVLSVGSRGYVFFLVCLVADMCSLRFSAVPQAAEFLDPPTLSKGKTERTKIKRKEAAREKSPVVDITGFTAFAAASPLSGSPALSDTALIPRALDSPAPPTMMKSNFAQVSEPTSGAGTPVAASTSRTKVAFGFGMKRKAGEEAQGFPPSKKR